jgi:hypothetical protein
MSEICIKTDIASKEGEFGYSFSYFSVEQRDIICVAAGEIIKELELTPAVKITPAVNFCGEYGLWFDDEDQSKVFFERLIKDLDVKYCE